MNADNISQDEVVKMMERINVLKQGKESLNVIMAGVDKME